MYVQRDRLDPHGADLSQEPPYSRCYGHQSGKLAQFPLAATSGQNETTPHATVQTRNVEVEAKNTWRCYRCGVQAHRRGKLCDHERSPKKLSLRKYARCFCARTWTACGEHNAKNIKAMHAPILIGRNISGCDCHYVRTSESQVELTQLIFVWLGA